jgi:hypothetical protein
MCLSTHSERNQLNRPSDLYCETCGHGIWLALWDIASYAQDLIKQAGPVHSAKRRQKYLACFHRKSAPIGAGEQIMRTVFSQSTQRRESLRGIRTFEKTQRVNWGAVSPVP